LREFHFGGSRRAKTQALRNGLLNGRDYGGMRMAED